MTPPQKKTLREMRIIDVIFVNCDLIFKMEGFGGLSKVDTYWRIIDIARNKISIQSCDINQQTSSDVDER